MNENKIEFCVMDYSGDTRHQWNKNNGAEVDAAKHLFNELRKQGYMAYTLENDSKGQVVTEFDSSVQKLIFVPPMQGG